VNNIVLPHLHADQVEVEIWRADALEVRRGLSSELDEMRSYVRSKANPHWLSHAIDHHTGTVLAYVFGRRQDTVFLERKALLEPFGITRYFTDGWCVRAACGGGATYDWEDAYPENRE
jgi:insertion element IS1 protein InsB